MFVGRSREIVEVVQWLDGKLDAMVVCGLPGVGKSSLCEHVLRQRTQVATVRLDAQHWRGDVQQAMMHALSGALHVSWEEDEELLWAYLRDSPHLVLVENVESVAPLDFYAMLTHTSWHERGVRWLCTTRVLDVPEGLPCVHLGGLSQAHERTSALLILQSQLGDGLASELDEALLSELLQSLEYHPLSLMLCGQMMRWLGQDLVARRLIDSVHGGVDEAIWPYKRLDEVFASLWELLEDETRALLGRLSVMPQPVELADVWLLCAEVCDVQRACEQACRYGGLMHEGESLRMPQAWRTYCASHFRSHPVRYQAWLGQLTRHYLHKHEDVWTRWSRLDELEPLERLRCDRETLRWLLLKVSEVPCVEEEQLPELCVIVCGPHA